MSVHFSRFLVGVAAIFAVVAPSVVAIPGALAACRPVVLSLSKSSGIVTGDEYITIRGRGFTSGTRFYFGNRQATVLTANGSTTRLVATPSLPKAGTYAVTAKNGSISSVKSARARYKAKLPTRAKKYVDATKSGSQSGLYNTGSWAAVTCSTAVRVGKSRVRLLNGCEKGRVTLRLLSAKSGKTIQRATAKIPRGWKVGTAVSLSDGHIYVLLGRDNPRQKAKRAVYQIRKYSAKLRLIGSASLRAGKIDGGVSSALRVSSPSLALSGSTLQIYLGREMFADPNDGYVHQRNLALEVDVRSMKSFREVETYPWASHSMRQYVHADASRVIYVDHADAYPRSIQITERKLGKLVPDESGAIWPLTSFDALKFKGAKGDVFTGATLNGMAVHGRKVTLAGLSIPHSHPVRGVTGAKYQYSKNVYVTVTDLDSGKTTFRWLTTNHPRKPNFSLSEPSLTALPDGRSIMLYSQQNRKGKYQLVYRLLNVDGKPVATKKWKNIPFVPATPPVISGNRLVWFDASSHRLRESGHSAWFMYSLNIKKPASPKF